jgi:hypothetical protein
MKKISKGTFLRAFYNPLSVAKNTEYGNSLFGDFTILVCVEGEYFLQSSRIYYKAFETKEEDNYFMFSSERQALNYFNACQETAEAFSENAGTVAGGF